MSLFAACDVPTYPFSSSKKNALGRLSLFTSVTALLYADHELCRIRVQRSRSSPVEVDDVECHRSRYRLRWPATSVDISRRRIDRRRHKFVHPCQRRSHMKCRTQDLRCRIEAVHNLLHIPAPTRINRFSAAVFTVVVDEFPPPHGTVPPAWHQKFGESDSFGSS